MVKLVSPPGVGLDVLASPARRQALTGAVAVAGAAFWPRRGLAAGPLDRLDAMVERALAAFETPGVSLAVVQANGPPIARGYGVRSLGQPDRVDGHTAFPLASLTKAFTVAAIAELVADGRLDWEDKVAARLPDFALYDPVATREMTVRDLLSHRSGLGLGEGDLMIFPKTDFTRAELVRKLRFLKPAQEFRAGPAYDNVLYLVAGELIGAVSGQPWEDFVQQRLLTPLGMADAAPSAGRMRSRNQTALHARIDGSVRGVGPVRRLPPADETDLVNPAGGIRASAEDMARWMAVQLAHGALPDGRRLWSDESAQAMWSPLTVLGADLGPTAVATDPHFVLGALGWVVLDYRGTPIVMHAGDLPGVCTRLMLAPSKGLGVYIAVNSEEETLHEALAYGILDACLALPSSDYIAAGQAADAARRERRLKRAQTQALKRPEPTSDPSLPLAAYAGTYRSDWYGDVLVRAAGGSLAIDFTRTPALKGPLVPWQGETFLTRFPDRNVEDALATFERDPAGAVQRLRLKAASPSADFSYDYQDLDLKRVG